jgi:hypothetical protein
VGVKGYCRNQRFPCAKLLVKVHLRERLGLVPVFIGSLKKEIGAKKNRAQEFLGPVIYSTLEF